MKKIGTLVLYLSIALLLLWQLPWCYNFFARTSRERQFVLYSPVLNDFLITRPSDKGKIERVDLKGNAYTQAEKDSLLPFFYYRQLMQDGRLPAVICGKRIRPKQIRHTNLMYRTSPRDLNKPQIGLYFLLESMSDRVDLTMPSDVFRLTASGIEFVEMKTNEINERKSQQFTAVMQRKGCTFPIQYLQGNATTRKNYDNGYLLVDSKSQLFHLKMNQGMPFFRAISLPKGMKAVHPYVTEFSNRNYLGFVTDESQHLYVITLPDYALHKLDIPSFDAKQQDLTLIGNAAVWTFTLRGEKETSYYALDASTHQLLKEYHIPYESHALSGLHFTERNDKFVYPRW